MSVEVAESEKDADAEFEILVDAVEDPVCADDEDTAGTRLKTGLEMRLLIRRKVLAVQIQRANRMLIRRLLKNPRVQGMH